MAGGFSNSLKQREIERQELAAELEEQSSSEVMYKWIKRLGFLTVEIGFTVYYTMGSALPDFSGLSAPKPMEILEQMQQQASQPDQLMISSNKLSELPPPTVVEPLRIRREPEAVVEEPLPMTLEAVVGKTPEKSQTDIKEQSEELQRRRKTPALPKAGDYAAATPKQLLDLREMPLHSPVSARQPASLPQGAYRSALSSELSALPFGRRALRPNLRADAYEMSASPTSAMASFRAR